MWAGALELSSHCRLLAFPHYLCGINRTGDGRTAVKRTIICQAVSQFMYRKRSIVLAPCLLVIFLILLTTLSPKTAQSADSIVTSAWQTAKDSGRYDFTTTVDQTAYPVPSLRNSSRQPVEDYIGLAGSVDLPTREIEMSIWPDASFDPNRGVSVRVEGDRAYQRANGPTGKWEEIDNIANAFAPGGDPLGFLAGVKHVEVGETRTIDLGAGHQATTLTQYRFELDGPLYAAHLREEMETILREDGRLPAGMNFTIPDAYQQMTGDGELWIDADGLPSRLLINLDLPAHADTGRITASITSDLTNFDRERIATASTSFFVNPLTWTTFRWQDVGVSAEIRTIALVATTLLLLTIVTLQFGTTRAFYTAVSLTFIAATVLTPILQSVEALTFSAEYTAYQIAQENRTEKVEILQQTQINAQTTDWNPNIDPTQQQNAPQIIAEQAKVAFPQTPLRTTSTITDTTDSDGDGLIDLDEAARGTCDGVNLGVGTPCEGVLDPTDTDGDTLSDGLEVLQIGTLATQADSDHDGITDTLEIQGFTYDSVTTWYLNPREADSNKDGLNDGAECPVWNSAIDSLFDPLAVCPDTDSDGTPDVFDDDNDGDGVPDAVDLSPFSASGQVYNGTNPFALQVDNVALDKPLYVDIQIRPNNPDNLRLYHHVLDWPTDDVEGQIQRRLDTTWADTDDLSARSAAANASNGDIRIVPMLEITMPYTDSHYANLPITDTAPVNRVLGATVDSWIDNSQLDPFGITVSDVDLEAGTLAAYVPLNVTSDQYDTPHAFSARMYYRPNQGSAGRADWGTNHEYRLIWLVQMLNDQCIDPAEDEATCDREDFVSVIQVYQDDWHVTGLNVSEQLGLDAAILYEDYQEDNNLEKLDSLVIASWNLSNTFLRGRDCDTINAGTCTSDGVRDVSVANMESAVLSWFPDDPLVTTETFNYEHEAQLGLLIGRDAQGILEGEFADWTGFTPVTFLYAYERKDRTLNLNELDSPSGNVTTVDLDPNEVVSLTRATLSWTAYLHSDGAWAAMEPSAYLDVIDTDLSEEAYFQPADDSQESIEEATGRLVWAQLYAGTLIQGVNTLVEAGDQLTWTPSDDLPEATYDPISAPGVTNGFSTIITAFAQPYTAPLMRSFYGALSKLPGLSFLGKPYAAETGAIFDTLQNIFGTFNPLTATLLVAGVAGVTLMAIGYFTDDATLFRIGEIIMASITVVVMTVQFMLFMAAMRLAYITFQGFKAVASGMFAFATGFRAMGAIGLLIGLALTWGFAAFTILTKGLGGIESNVIISVSVALTIWFVLLFLIGFAGGGIIGLLLALVDAVFVIIGKKGPTQYVIEWLAGELYDVDMLINNLDSGKRLDINLLSMTYADLMLGFTPDNDLIVTLGITNSVKFDKAYGKGEAKQRAVFRYFLQEHPQDHHADLQVGEMEDEWTFIGNRTIRASETLSITVPLEDLPVGLGTPLGIYLNESFIAAYRGCWVDSDYCQWDKYKDTIHIDLSDMLAVDILPTTIEGFTNWRWNSATDLTLPTPVDFDNDGLSGADGTDPDDTTIDADGDGLTDFYELENGLDPESADGDGDNLNDLLELRFGTSPYLADSDGDGLTDDVEALGGWLTPYDGTKVMRVWSDPLSADIDSDYLNDLTEFVYGLHPNVPTDPSVINNLVQIDDLTVVEENPQAMRAFLRFEEDANAYAFRESSGNGNDATCTLATWICPTSAVAGRYGRGLHFNGITQFIELEFADGFDFSNGAFTQAAWIYPTHDDNDERGIMGDYGVDYELPPTLSVINQTQLTGGFGDGTNWNTFTTGSVLTLDAWNHVAATFDGTTYRVYVDATEVYSNAAWVGSVPHPNNVIDIGRRTPSDNFEGRIDEVAIFSNALDGDALTELMMGRINPSDLIVTPDTELRYQATVTNSLVTQSADGFMIAASEPISPAVPSPEIVLHLDGDERVKQYVPDSGNSTTLTCIDDGTTCPSNSGGRHGGHGIIFDGVDDMATFPTFNVREESDIDGFWDYFTLNFWLRVETLPPPGERTYIFDTEAEVPGALDVYIDSDGWIWFDVQDSIIVSNNTTASAYDGFNGHHFPPVYDADDYYDDLLAGGSTHGPHGMRIWDDASRLNKWNNLVFIYLQGDPATAFDNRNISYLYADYPIFEAPPNFGQLSVLYYEIQGEQYDGLRFGPGTVGTGASDNYYDGQMDEIAIYNGYQIFQGSQDALTDFFNATYNTQGASPSYLLRFDPDTETVGYIDDVSGVIRADCDESASCPARSASGQEGEALLFDGVDDKLHLGMLDFAMGDYTIAGWFNTSHNDYQSFFGALDPTSPDSPAVGFGVTNNGAVTFFHGFPHYGDFPVGLSSANGYNDGNWHHFAATRSGDTSTLYLDGIAVDSGSGSRASEYPLDVWFGRLNAFETDYYFDGELDDLVIIPAALDANGVELLRQTSWPAIEIPDAYLPYEVAPLSSFVISGTAQVAESVPSSLHRFDQEVEAAINLQQLINIPIVDDNAGNVKLFAPFEDAPGDTVFENIAGSAEFGCPSDSNCPQVGLRGIIDRAALFDGVDDYLLIEDTTQMLSFSAWVQADRGVIFDTRKNYPYAGIELDVAQLRVLSGGNGNEPATDEYTLALDLDAGAWNHLVVTINKSSNTVKAYVNGSEVGTINYTGNDPFTGRPTLGANTKGGDFLNGFLDDFRAYDIVLSASDVTALYEKSPPILRFEFDETEDDIVFADASPNRFIGVPATVNSVNSLPNQTTTTLNPAPGSDGKIGNIATFHSGPSMTVDPDDDSAFDLNELTIMLWVKPEGARGPGVWQNLLSKHGTGGINRNYQLNIVPETLQLSFSAQIAGCSSFISGLQANTELIPDYWTHVAVTFDGDSAEMYINGQLDNSKSYPNITLCQNDESIKIGGGYLGEMDELALYGRSLSAQEVSSIYLRELRWYRATASELVTVDTEVPTIELLSDAAYHKNGYIQLAVAARDVWSYVQLLDFGIKAPGESEFTWGSADLCAESLPVSNVWCPNFDSTEYSGEGIYEVQFRAIDAVGNETISSIYTLNVDGQAPTVTTSYNDTWGYPTPDAVELLQWVLPLSATISDPLVAGAIAGSGVATPTVSVALYNQLGIIVGNGLPQTMTPLTAESDMYVVDYEFNGLRPFGLYDVVVTVEDAVDNEADTTAGTLWIDTEAPVVDTFSADFGTAITETIILSGTVHDSPDWTDPLVQLHFEDASGATKFLDSSENGTHATCIACPTIDTGAFGQGVSFDGATHYVEIPATLNTMTETFSAATWLYVDSYQSSTLITQRDTNGVAWLYINGAGQLASNLAGGLVAPDPVATSAWTHTAVTYDGTTLRIYQDGIPVAEKVATVLANESDFLLGVNKSLATSFFAGKLDETVIYPYELAVEEIYKMAQSTTHGVASVDVWVEQGDTFTDSLRAPVTPDWQPATVSGSAWEFGLPTGVETLAQIHVRGADSAGNSGENGVVWRGLIDQIAPRVTFTGTHIISGSLNLTEFTFTFDDYLLDEMSWQHPCLPADLTITSYAMPGSPLDTLPHSVSGTCQLDGLLGGTFEVTVCDVAGLCTTDSVTLSVPTAVEMSAISTTSPPLSSAVILLFLALSGLCLHWRQRCKQRVQI